MRDFKLGITLAAVAAGFAVASCDGAGEQAANDDPTRVEIDSGVLVGAVERDDVVTFKGVPFAQAPVGELRWRAPQPISWEGERTATEWALPCPQPLNEDGTANGGGVAGETSEDCLYLNVFAPVDAENAPVMMWLYGGAGYLGAGHLGSYQGYSFAKDDVILVTINYRLGALGNFAHPALSEGEQGSFAMMDSIAALQWIQNNIDQFGGNPNNVTLFGQSAGGALVSNLLASPAAEGLFHKAIIHSGTSLDGGRSLEDSEALGAEIATTLGLNGADATAEELRAISPDQFTTAGPPLRTGVTGVNDGTIRVGSLREAIANGTAHDVPLIVGSNNGEGGADRSNELVNLAADGAPAWQYYFTYVPEWRTAEWQNGAIHSAELMFAFDSTDTSSWGGDQTTDADREVARLVHSCWSAFAHMDPASETISCADGFEWQARTEENDVVAVFGATPEQAEMATVLDDIEARSSARAAAAANAG